jgi:conjugative transfer region protein TrbK
MTSIRIAALAILSGVVLQTGFHLSASAQSSAPPQPTNPLGQELQRCKALHEQAATDPRCQAAYKRSRDQFFGSGMVPYNPRPVDVFPNTRGDHWTTEKKQPDQSTTKP